MSPRTGSPFTKHSISSCPAKPVVRVGVRCQWSMRPPILALESLVRGFLAEGPGLFCLLPTLLTFGESLIHRHPGHICGAGPGKLFLLADSFLGPYPAPSGMCPQPMASLLAPGSQHLFTRSLSSQSNKGCPAPSVPPRRGIGLDTAVGQHECSWHLRGWWC